MSRARVHLHDFEQKLAAAGIKMRPFYKRFWERYPDIMQIEFDEFVRAVEQPLTTSDYRMAERADRLSAEMKRDGE